MKFLLIEDDSILNETITDYLKLKGNEVIDLEDGADAINIIDKSNFDLYIIDINIPHINGLEIVKYIRNKDIKTHDSEYEELNVNGVAKRLRKKEKRLLNLFLNNINKILTTEKIENYVWENEIKDSYPLRQLINDLRKHFDNGENFIFANRGIGYKFEIKS
jgi:DNA-binding response OmpR family regulator